jgi:hypothetical protein
VTELYRRIAAGMDVVTGRLGDLDAAAAERLGTHPTLGEMRVADVVARMLAGHLEEHVTQLERMVDGPAAGR